MSIVFSDEEDVSLVDFLPPGTTVTSDHYMDTWGKLVTCFQQMCPTLKMSCQAYLSVCTTETFMEIWLDCDNLHLLHQTLIQLWRKNFGDIIMKMTMYWSMPY